MSTTSVLSFFDAFSALYLLSLCSSLCFLFIVYFYSSNSLVCFSFSSSLHFASLRFFFSSLRSRLVFSSLLFSFSLLRNYSPLSLLSSLFPSCILFCCLQHQKRA